MFSKEFYQKWLLNVANVVEKIIPPKIKPCPHFFYQFQFLLVCNITDKKQQQQPNDSQNCVSTLPRGCIYNFPLFFVQLY